MSKSHSWVSRVVTAVLAAISRSRRALRIRLIRLFIVVVRGSAAWVRHGCCGFRSLIRGLGIHHGRWLHSGGASREQAAARVLERLAGRRGDGTEYNTIKRFAVGAFTQKFSHTTDDEVAAQAHAHAHLGGRQRRERNRAEAVLTSCHKRLAHAAARRIGGVVAANDDGVDHVVGRQVVAGRDGHLAGCQRRESSCELRTDIWATQAVCTAVQATTVRHQLAVGGHHDGIGLQAKQVALADATPHADDVVQAEVDVHGLALRDVDAEVHADVAFAVVTGHHDGAGCSGARLTQVRRELVHHGEFLDCVGPRGDVGYGHSLGVRVGLRLAAVVITGAGAVAGTGTACTGTTSTASVLGFLGLTGGGVAALALGAYARQLWASLREGNHGDGHVVTAAALQAVVDDGLADLTPRPHVAGHAVVDEAHHLLVGHYVPHAVTRQDEEFRLLIAGVHRDVRLRRHGLRRGGLVRGVLEPKIAEGPRHGKLAVDAALPHGTASRLDAARLLGVVGLVVGRHRHRLAA